MARSRNGVDCAGLVTAHQSRCRADGGADDHVTQPMVLLVDPARLNSDALPKVRAATVAARGSFCRWAWNVAADAMAKSAMVCSEKNEL